MKMYGLTQKEFEKVVKEKDDKIKRSIEWNRKKRERDAKKPEDKSPWMPKNLTQKEINEWAINHTNTIEYIDKIFKDPCQEEQVLREMVILDRDHRNDLKRWYKASIKKYRPDISKEDRDKIVKNIERNTVF